MGVGFYQYQLSVLAVVCVAFLILERYLKKIQPDHVKEAIIEENIEVGHPALQTNGATVPLATLSRAGALNKLLRKYLTVYAIVMGQCIGISPIPSVDISQRCRLAPRPIRLLSLSRPI